jgi:dihydroorotase
MTRPDDFHLHLRDSAFMSSVIRDSASQFGRAIIMPNLATPVVNIQHAKAYRERILAVLPEDSQFEPLMTLYLTDNTTLGEIETAIQSKIIYAVKYYPSGSTINSESGVTNIENIYPLLEFMIEHDFPLLVHGEVTDPDVDIFDREAVFIDTILVPLVKRYDRLRLVFEHVSTLEGIDFITAGSQNITATITPHHLLLNRNNIFINGLRPHHYCLPVLKSEIHRQAVLEAATSGNPKFFLGTDSAPHAKCDKESGCCPAGIYSAYNAMAIYAECFEQAGCLDRLEGFASYFGADFYRLPRNQDTITLVKKEWTVPESLPFGELSLVRLRAGETCQWMLVES